MKNRILFLVCAGTAALCAAEVIHEEGRRVAGQILSSRAERGIHYGIV